jgi:chemotaxis protein MotB
MLISTLALSISACGYSKEEWDQKLRDNDSLRAERDRALAASKKSEVAFRDAVGEVELLKKQLTERGVDPDNLNASLEQQRKALDEYRQRAEQLDQLKKRLELLRSKLKKLTELGLKVEVRDNRMLIQLPGDVLFDSGKDTLKPEGTKILAQVAEVIRSDQDLSKREFQVAAHTDNKPLKAGPFRDNWSLSSMRAKSVLVFLTTPLEQTGGGLNSSKWSAAGYGDTDPLVTNDAEEGPPRNRRVELVVVPDVDEMLNLNSIAAP